MITAVTKTRVVISTPIRKEGGFREMCLFERNVPIAKVGGVGRKDTYVPNGKVLVFETYVPI